jgi:hypothetical protein
MADRFDLIVLGAASHGASVAIVEGAGWGGGSRTQILGDPKEDSRLRAIHA